MFLYVPFLFNCRSGTANCHETALELVSGATVLVIVGAFCSIFRARHVGTCVEAKFGPKPAKNQIQIMIFITYSKRRLVKVALGPNPITS